MDHQRAAMCCEYANSKRVSGLDDSGLKELGTKRLKNDR
jgi:hypothetical protein